jgi:hypothetical protein
MKARLRCTGARALVAAALLETSCRGHAAPDDCRAISEHYMDLAVREAPGSASLSPTQAAAVREVERGLKRAQPAFRAVQDRCDQVTRTEVSCAVEATSTKAWEGCLGDAGR